MTNDRFGPLPLLLVLSLVLAACGSSSSDSESSGGETEPITHSSAPAMTTTASADDGSGDDGSGDDSLSAGSTSAEAVAAGGDSKYADLSAEAPEGGVRPEIESTVPDLPRPQPSSNLLTAADVDDNLNFTFFGQYLERIVSQYGQSSLPSVDLSNRTVVTVIDEQGAPVVNAVVRSGEFIAFSNPNGLAYLFGQTDGTVVVTSADGSASVEAAIQADSATARLELESTSASGLDLAIVLDTTGSMGDELAFLTKEFEAIVRRTAEAHPDASLRFALIVYRDVGDQYVTRAFDFTDDPSTITGQLADQRADGGGDYPEAVDAALADALELDWRSDVSRVLVLNADAPPHTEHAAAALATADRLGELGVRIYPLAASGVADEAEYLFRIMAARTGGRYLFLTNDSGIGAEKAEPKVQCYVVTTLNDLLVRLLDTELSLGRIEAGQSEIVRTVGTYDSGVCLASEQE